MNDDLYANARRIERGTILIRERGSVVVVDAPFHLGLPPT
jgi:hypothetical protein